MAKNNIKVGDIIKFGRYPFETDGAIRPIKWLVLKRKGDTALIITKYAIDAKPYDNGIASDEPWTTCSLRYWLNNDFFHLAFSDKEKMAIKLSKVKNDDPREYDKHNKFGWRQTKDKIFLLSEKEAFQKYFHSDKERWCDTTPFARRNGGYRDSDCEWWLRSQGNYHLTVMAVERDGSLYDREYLSNTSTCVRPALWIDLQILESMSRSDDKKSDWVLTDPDSFQIRRKLCNFSKDLGSVYELYQLQELPIGTQTETDSEEDQCFRIAHSIIFCSEIDIENVCDCYGYDNLDVIKNEYGDDWEGILAECDFELMSGCMENLLNTPSMTYQQAKDMICKLSGYVES